VSYSKAGTVAGVPTRMRPVYHSRGTRASEGALRAEADGEGDTADPTQVGHPSTVRTQPAQTQIDPAPIGPVQVPHRQVGLRQLGLA
jgi:hypothetical protein